MRARVIINPSSGRQIYQKNAEGIVEQLLADGTLRHAEIIRTAGQYDAYRAARDFHDGEVDLVIAVGGDGTHSEVINGLLDGRHTTPLAILPAGTDNDFAKFMKMPQGVQDFCETIRRQNIISVDAGRSGNQFFMNVVAGGLLTDIAYKVPSQSKTVLGKLAYLIEAARDMTSPELRSFSIKLHSPVQVIEDDILLFIVTNSPDVGGFRNLAPKASVTDNLLDVLVIHKQSFLDMVTLLLQIVKGNHIDNRSVSYFQTDELTIECLDADPVILDFDGERGNALPDTIKVVPRAINLVVPP